MIHLGFRTLCSKFVGFSHKFTKTGHLIWSFKNILFTSWEISHLTKMKIFFKDFFSRMWTNQVKSDLFAIAELGVPWPSVFYPQFTILVHVPPPPPPPPPLSWNLKNLKKIIFEVLIRCHKLCELCFQNMFKRKHGWSLIKLKNIR